MQRLLYLNWEKNIYLLLDYLAYYIYYLCIIECQFFSCCWWIYSFTPNINCIHFSMHWSNGQRPSNHPFWTGMFWTGTALVLLMWRSSNRKSTKYWKLADNNNKMIIIVNKSNNAVSLSMPAHPKIYLGLILDTQILAVNKHHNLTSVRSHATQKTLYTWWL